MSLCQASFKAQALTSLSEVCPYLLGSLIHSLVNGHIAHRDIEGTDAWCGTGVCDNEIRLPGFISAIISNLITLLAVVNA